MRWDPGLDGMLLPREEATSDNVCSRREAALESARTDPENNREHQPIFSKMRFGAL